MSSCEKPTVHHNEQGICLHGLTINSVCAHNEQTSLNSDERVSNKFYLCLNMTNAHDSYAQDRHSDRDSGIVPISRQIQFKIGFVKSITPSDFVGDDIFEYILEEDVPLKNANGGNLKVYDELEGTGTVVVRWMVDRIYDGLRWPTFFCCFWAFFLCDSERFFFANTEISDFSERHPFL